jgi:hypothetical protein
MTKLIQGSFDDRGKGGSFQTKPNPFTNGGEVLPAPALNGKASLGVAIDNVVHAGCAIMIGQTRDGGALVFTVLDGDDRHRTYCSNDGELDRALLALHKMYGK